MNRLRELRTEKGLTQLQLSELINIGYKTISDYERGKSEPDFKNLNIIANFFDVSTDYLIGKSRNENRLKELRTEKNITLRELADAININYTAISRIETGDRGLNSNDITALTNFFNCSTDYLLGLTDNKGGVINEPQPESLSDIKLEIIRTIDSITDEETLKAILKMVQCAKSE